MIASTVAVRNSLVLILASGVFLTPSPKCLGQGSGISIITERHRMSTHVRAVMWFMGGEFSRNDNGLISLDRILFGAIGWNRTTDPGVSVRRSTN